MQRSLCVLAIGLSLSLSLSAAEPSKKTQPAAAVAAPPRAIAGRTQLEALLQSPAKLDFEGRKRLTVREVFEKLHEQHHLSIRFDTPTLAALFETAQQPSSYHPGQVASVWSLLPIGIMSTYSSNPCGPNGCPPSGTMAYKPPLTVQYVDEPSPPAANLKAKMLQEAMRDAKANAKSRREKLEKASEELDRSEKVPAAGAVPPAISTQPLPPAGSGVSTFEVPRAVAPAPTAQTTLPPANAPPYTPGDPSTLPSASPPKLSPGEPSDSSDTAGSASLAPSAPDHALPKAIAPDSDETEEPATPYSSANSLQEKLEELLETEIDVQTLDLSRVSIATILRHALDAAPTTSGEDSAGMPILMTNAALLDYLIEDDGLLITSRMKALSTRETRVYSLKNLNGIPSEQLTKTIRQSIRPWSWRSQINDLGDQLKGTPLPAETMTSLIKSGVQLIGAEVNADEEPAETKPTSKTDDAKELEMLGGAIANGLVTFTQTTLLVMEMMHYAEPPTATIQTLGNKLIVTQSQTAHREIAELLKQLSDE